VAPNGARPSTVPLEAGIGPANPPCPACGEPLFGWATTPDATPVRRCEACGLGVVGDPGDGAEALAALERLRIEGGGDPRYRIANRASLQASLGGSGWALIETDSRYLFTTEAVRRLASGRDQQVARVRWRPGSSTATMWGTLLNSFTWGRNVALGALGRAVTTPADRRWQRGMDATISVVATPIVLLAALLMETGAAVAGRGGVLELTLRLE
jgi:hypothetical protein